MLAVFMFYKALVQYFFDWDKIEGNNNDSQVQMKKRSRSFLLLNSLIDNNYMYLTLWYYFIDSTSIYPTSFEVVTYFVVFLNHSYVLAAIKIIDKFIAEVIDA